jgi:hypothetical protein
MCFEIGAFNPVPNQSSHSRVLYVNCVYMSYLYIQVVSLLPYTL